MTCASRLAASPLQPGVPVDVAAPLRSASPNRSQLAAECRAIAELNDLMQVKRSTSREMQEEVVSREIDLEDLRERLQIEVQRAEGLEIRVDALLNKGREAFEVEEGLRNELQELMEERKQLRKWAEAAEAASAQLRARLDDALQCAATCQRQLDPAAGDNLSNLQATLQQEKQHRCVSTAHILCLAVAGSWRPVDDRLLFEVSQKMIRAALSWPDY